MVQRYGGVHELHPQADGAWVAHEDCAVLEGEILRLREVLRSREAELVAERNHSQQLEIDKGVAESQRDIERDKVRMLCDEVRQLREGQTAEWGQLHERMRELAQRVEELERGADLERVLGARPM